MEWLDREASARLGLVHVSVLRTRLSTRQIGYMVQRGRLHRVLPGVFRLAGAPVTWPQEQLAGELHLGDEFVTGFRSAARLWGVPGIPAVRHEYVGSRRHRTRDGLVVHVSNLLPPHHVTSLGPHRVTTAARTLADLSAVVAHDRLGRAVDECERAGLCTPVQVDQVRDELRARGRRRTTVIDEVLEARLDRIGAGDSELAAKSLRWIESSALPRPVTDYWVVARGNRYCLDIAWPTEKVCVECDGFDNHRMRHRFDGDRDKFSDLALAGWLVLPMTSRTDRHLLVRRITDALAARAS